MSVTFTKLFSSITESTIWCEDSDTRVVWITLLAMSDKYGRVWASIPGLAKRAAVSLQATELALAKFLGPDRYSRSNTYAPDAEGRRIQQIEGGWKIINHAHYRQIRDEEERRAYKAAHERQRRSKKRGHERGQTGQTWTPVDSGGHNADADADRAVKGFEVENTNKAYKSSGFSNTSNSDDLDVELYVQEIANIYPKITNPKHLSQEVAYAIAEAVQRDGRDIVFAGTKSMAEAVAKWPKTELRFVPSPSRYFRESQYQKNPAEWERTNGNHNGKETLAERNKRAFDKAMGRAAQ